MNTFERVRHIVAEKLDTSVEKITLETAFDDLSMDSLDKVEIVLEVEEQFGIELEEEALTLTEIRPFVEYVERKVSGAG